MLEYVALDLGSHMAIRVVIKLGGGLITDKGKMKKFDHKAVELVVETLCSVSELGVSIVLRSENQSEIDDCNSQILKFVKEKKIEVVDR